MIVLGVSALEPGASAAITQDGVLLACADEGRFTRQESDPNWPRWAIKACLDEAGLGLDQIDRVACNELPHGRFLRVLAAALGSGFPGNARPFVRSMKRWLGQRLWVRNRICAETGIHPERVHFFSAHACYMAHALTSSPFQQADVLVVDSAGEWSTVSGAHVKRGQEWQVEPLLEVPFPHSIGLVGSALTTWAGFRASEGEDELLKLAVHGEPIHRALFEEILPALTDGTFRLEKGWVHVEELETAPYGCPLSSRWIEKLGPPRDSRLGWTLGSVDGSSPTAVDQNVANVVASFEAIKFDRVLALCHRLQQQTNARRLCLTGPLAANPQLIRRLAESGPYEHIHVPWETGTLGAAAGAASLVGKEEHKVSTKRTQISPYMGMSLEYADDLAMIPLLKPNKWARFRKRGTQDPTGATVEVTHFKEDLEGLATAVAEALAQGTPVGWLQDRFGDGQGARGRRVLLASAGSRQAWEDIRTGITGQPPYHRPSLVISQEEARVVLPRADLSSRAVCWGQQEVWVAPASRERVQGCLLDDAHLTALVCTSDDHPKLSILLRRWREISGVGALAATPLKEHGTPIATDLAEASIILARTNLTLLVVGDALITKRWS